MARPSAPPEGSAPAGTVAEATLLQITGDPASRGFIREQAALAAARASRPRGTASVIADPQALDVPSPLRPDDVTNVDVPVTIRGAGYLAVHGRTHVRVVNVALPRSAPNSLLVSEAPDELTDSGVLFSTDVVPDSSYRLLYHHSSAPRQPGRRIVLLAHNTSTGPALVQIVAGSAGPQKSEMEVGHLATRRFLERLVQNEGTVVVIPGNSTVVLADQPLSAGEFVSSLMQVFELDGAPLRLILMAQNQQHDATAASTLPSSDRPRAGREYRTPEFLFERTSDAGESVTIPIGRIPLPNVRGDRPLSGDYGVLQNITLRLVNNDRTAAHVALYANPRGGRATGTFLIDGVLVQAKAMEPFTYYKLREYTVPADGYLTTAIVTMPENGSLYPLNLILAPDDGSISPGAPGSPVY